MCYSWWLEHKGEMQAATVLEGNFFKSSSISVSTFAGHDFPKYFPQCLPTASLLYLFAVSAIPSFIWSLHTLLGVPIYHHDLYVWSSSLYSAVMYLNNIVKSLSYWFMQYFLCKVLLDTVSCYLQVSWKQWVIIFWYVLADWICIVFYWQ
jgi:hypothetical protein